jgi:phosphatidylinositol alpha-mannosyltransferase
LRICILVPYDLADEGGVKRHAFHLARAMRRAGDFVEIVGPLSRRAKEPHVHGFGGVVNVPANGSANRMSLLASARSVERFFRHRRFDVVHLHEPMVPMLSYYTLWYSPAAAHVATFHMYSEREGGASRVARAALAKLLFPRIDSAIAVSPAAAEYASRFWHRPLPIIPNGVSTTLYSPPSDGAPRTPAAPLRLLFVGSWRDRRKGLPVLLEAYRLLRAAGQSVTLQVIGKGIPRREQAELPGVTFDNSIDSEAALADHYRSCDVFVSPATGQESFGIVLLEAMACGRAIVCSDIRGYRDLVDPEGARLVPAGDAAALARAIGELAHLPQARRAMGLRNRVHAELYDWGRIATDVRHVYLEAIRSKSRDRTGAFVRTPQGLPQQSIPPPAT